MKEDGIPEPFAISKAARGLLDGLNSSVDGLCFSICSIEDIPERLSPFTPLGRILPAPQLEVLHPQPTMEIRFLIFDGIILGHAFPKHAKFRFFGKIYPLKS